MRTLFALGATSSVLLSRTSTGFRFAASCFLKRLSFSPIKVLRMAAESVRPIIAVDIDEVLAQFTPTLAEFHNEQYGGPTLTVDSFVSYEFHRVWGGTVEECGRKMEAFFESNHFKRGLNPLPHAFDVLQRMKAKYSLHVVTARQHKVEEITRSWLNTHFPNTFDEVHFGNHYSKDGKSRSKAEICKTIGAKLLIDDNLIYATQCALEGISVVLFGKYPWNREVYDHPSHFHDVSVVVNAHTNNEVVLEDFDPSHSLLTHIEEELAAPHHVYRVHSWEVMEQAVAYMLSKRRDMALHGAPAADVTTSNTAPSGQKGKRSLAIAAIQMCSTNDKEINFQSTVSLIEQALHERAVDMICLPECSAFMGLNALQTAEQGEVIEQSSYVQRICALAREKGIWISLGGFPEQSSIAAENHNNVNKLFNTHVVIDRQGKIVARYRKVHLFDCPLVGLKESALTAPGDELVVVDVEGWKIGLSVCYDLRFAPFYEALRQLADGLDCILVPAAFTVPTGAAHWEILLRARAIEQQCYVVAAAQAGQHNEKRASFGHSMVVDPWGKIAGQLRGEDSGVCYAVLEKDRVEEVRRNMPIREHYRPVVYCKKD